MSKYCLQCGEPMGTRELLHDTASCDRCRERTALAKPEKRSKSGLLDFVAEIERRNPLAGTGKLKLPGGSAED
ncbi:MAG TPA: hypothetical protein V6D47_05820 [Oscillatoriaceae cyanobacterium]